MNADNTVKDKDARRVQKRASVHPATVTALSEGKVDGPKKTRKKAERRVQPVHTHIKLDPLAAAAVAEIVAKGVYTRVTILSPELAIVR